MSGLNNPEHRWRRRSALPPERAALEARIGPLQGPVEVLSGGLANLNLRLCGARVLRIYLRDRAAAAVEASLLRRPWRSFKVPALLGSGSDFLLVEYVTHRRLAGTAREGRALGRALAEIHSLSFPCAGFLGPDLAVARPFSDPVEALMDYAISQLEPATPVVRDLAPFLLACLADRGPDLRRLAQSSVLIHGDFKPSNLHWAGDDRPLVLDWEFAYAGPALMDVGQLIRWGSPLAFSSAFAESYQEHGGRLPEDWQMWANTFDLFNLVGLLAGAEPGSLRAEDVRQRIGQTLSNWGHQRIRPASP